MKLQRPLVRAGLLALSLGAPIACTPRKAAPAEEPVASAEPPVPATTSPAPSSSAASTVPTSASLDDPTCPARKMIGSLSFAPDGTSLLTACAGGGRVCGSSEPDWDTFVDVWDLRAGRLAKRLDAGMSNIALRWGPGGLLATSADPTTGPGEVRVFDGGTFAQRFQTGFYCIQDVEFDARGTSLAIAGADGRIGVVDLASNRMRRRPDKEAHLGGDYGVSVKFTPDSRTLFVMDEAEGAQSLSAATLRRTSNAVAPLPFVCATVAPDGGLLAATDESGALFVLQGSDVRRRMTLASGGDKCTRLAWVDAKRFVLASSAGKLTLWDATGKTPSRELRAAAPTTIATLTPDPTGAKLVTEDSEGALSLWDIATGSQGRTLLGPIADEAARVSVIEWSPRGDRLAVFAGRRFMVWDVATGAVLAEIPSPSDAKDDHLIAWRSDGQMLAVADETVRLVRLTDRAIVALSVVEREGQRIGLVGAASGAYAGPPDLARCAPRSGPARAASTTLRASLLADFMAGRPIDVAP